MFKFDVSREVVQISHLVHQLANVETAEARYCASNLLKEEVSKLNEDQLAEIVAVMSLGDLNIEPRLFTPPHARFLEKEGRVHAISFRRIGDEFNVIVELPELSHGIH